MFGLGSKSIVGLDVGSSSIKAVELKRTRAGIEVTRARLDVDEVDRGPTVTRRVGRRHKRIRRRPDPVVGAYVQRLTHEMEGACGIAHGDRVRGIEQQRDFSFEQLDLGPLGEIRRAQHLDDVLDIRFVHALPRVRNECGAGGPDHGSIRSAPPCANTPGPARTTNS